MKCVKCGAVLKEGCIYCSVCGTEVQIEPDYSVLEDDYLRSILQEGAQNQTADTGTRAGRGNTTRESQEKTVSDSKQRASGQKAAGNQKMSRKVPIIAVCCLLAVAIIIGIVVKITINYKNANSYDYQVEMAGQEEIDKNYENALHYYKTALSLKPDDIAVRLSMSKIYMERKEYDSAMVLFVEVVEMDGTNKEAYRNLIKIYEQKKDYDSITELASGIENEDILKLFEGYIVTLPVISPLGGEFDEYVDVTLYSAEDFDIYYTMDGSVPDAQNGTLYDERKSIKLEKDGRYEISAVCINEKGIVSDVVTETYDIEVPPPKYAAVSPDGGRIDTSTQVTITAEAGCSIYYTWDGTDPTRLSARYEEPLEIPTGNNILSVLVVDDETGLDSGVYRTNFIYYP